MCQRSKLSLGWLRISSQTLGWPKAHVFGVCTVKWSYFRKLGNQIDLTQPVALTNLQFSIHTSCHFGQKKWRPSCIKCMFSELASTSVQLFFLNSLYDFEISKQILTKMTGMNFKSWVLIIQSNNLDAIYPSNTWSF